MRPPPSLVLVLLSFAVVAGSAESVKRDFESEAVGAPPAGFDFARTGDGAEGQWVVRVERCAPLGEFHDLGTSFIVPAPGTP